MTERTSIATSATETGTGGLLGVFAKERQAILRFLVARSGSHADAEDLLHELWERITKGTGGPVSNPRAYLFKAANNLVLDRRRAERRRVTREEVTMRDEAIGSGADPIVAEHGPNGLEAVLAKEAERALKDAIASLPDGARRVLILHKIEERSQAEVAQELGISRSGVEKHMAVAMRHLRATLIDCGDDLSVASSKHTRENKA